MTHDYSTNPVSTSQHFCPNKPVNNTEILRLPNLYSRWNRTCQSDSISSHSVLLYGDQYPASSKLHIHPSPPPQHTHTHTHTRVTYNFTPDMKTLGCKWRGEGKAKGWVIYAASQSLFWGCRGSWRHDLRPMLRCPQPVGCDTRGTTTVDDNMALPSVGRQLESPAWQTSTVSWRGIMTRTYVRVTV
jgi:hypothetical protein